MHYEKCGSIKSESSYQFSSEAQEIVCKKDKLKFEEALNERVEKLLNDKEESKVQKRKKTSTKIDYAKEIFEMLN